MRPCCANYYLPAHLHPEDPGWAELQAVGPCPPWPLVPSEEDCLDYRHPFGTCDCWERIRRFDAGLRAVLAWKLDRDGELGGRRAARSR
jgi:hypothetical protein